MFSNGSAPNFGLFFVIFADSTNRKYIRVMLILVIQKAVDIEVPGLIITMVGLKRLIHEDIHSMNSKMLKLTCFDVTFMEMFFTSKDFVVFDLPLEVFICYSVFGRKEAAGSFHMPIPLVLRQVPQPTTEQLSPGMFKTTFL